MKPFLTGLALLCLTGLCAAAAPNRIFMDELDLSPIRQGWGEPQAKQHGEGGHLGRHGDVGGHRHRRHRLYHDGHDEAQRPEPI